jgi:hypothetical protein
VESRSTRHCGHQWPIVPARGDYDDGEIGGMIGRGNRSTRRKPAPVPLCPPQTLHAARTRTRAAAVGNQRLTAWATARPWSRPNYLEWYLRSRTVKHWVSSRDLSASACYCLTTYKRILHVFAFKVFFRISSVLSINTTTVEITINSEIWILQTISRTPWRGDQPVVRPLPT